MYDVAIVGSGAGAAPIAYELSNAGYKVVVLEKGKHYNTEDFNKDELSVARNNLFTPSLDDEYHLVNDIDKDGKAYKRKQSFWNGSLVGGSSNLMSGYFHRMKPNDFKLKSVYGEIKGANVVDWPISYDDLEPYYDKVEKVVGVSGRVVDHKFQEKRSSKDFPFEPLAEQAISSWIDDACKKLNFTSMPTPRAVLALPALQRNSCSYSNFCGSYACATGAKSHAKVALLDKALKNGNLTIISEAFVYKIDSSKTDVTSLKYIKNSKEQEIKAKIYVVAAQAIESSRLLLNSKNSFFPYGLANNNKQVGKNLIFSAGGSGEGRLYKKDLPKSKQDELLVRGLFVNRSLQDWYEYFEYGKAYKGGTIDFLFEHQNPVPRALEALYNGNDIVWGKELSKNLKTSFLESKVITFEVFNDWLPTDGTFVDVDDTHKDKFEQSVALLSFDPHKQDIKVGKHLAQKAEQVLRELGCKEMSTGISSAPPPNLVAGGCRFGEDKKTSVLDKNCKAHELNNLYVSDASFMPTGGSVPYTWTIYANSFRVADMIKEHLQS